MLDPLSAKLDQYMTMLSARQKLVSSNIANIDTPGYKTKDLDFDSELQSAQLRTAKSAQPGALAYDVPGLRVKNDGNNVDLDRESRLLAENGLRFSIASNIVRNQLKAIRAAITGGTP
jgi:flagellar basal-body rod protein FlgB